MTERLWITMDRLGCVELWSEEPHETPGGQWAADVPLSTEIEALDDHISDALDLSEGSKLTFELVKREGRE